MFDENSSPQDHVESMLKNYQQNKRIMMANAATIESFTPLTRDEVMDMLNFPHKAGNFVQNTNLSQKPLQIASSYKTVTRQLNREALQAMADDYQAANSEVCFVDYAILRLPPDLRTLAYEFIADGYAWSDVLKKHGLANSTLARRRRSVIDALTVTYLDKFSLFVLENGQSGTKVALER